MTYTRQTWQDGNTALPVSAARLGVMEQGIYDAHYKPGCRVYNSAAQSIPNNTATPLVFSAARFNNGGMWTAAANNRVTIPVSGVYVVTCGLEWVTNATGERDMNIRVNGSTFIVAQYSGASGALQRMFVSTVWGFTAGDYIEFLAFQLSGGALNTVASTVTNGPAYQYSPECCVQMVSYA